MARQNVHCIVCDQIMLNLVPDGNQPSGGLAFISSGHYGSTVFDPMDGTFLEINVCEECLIKARNKHVVLIGSPSPPPRSDYETWRDYEPTIE